MKKLIAVLLTLTLIFSFAACGGKTTTDVGSDATGTDAQNTDTSGDNVATTAPTAQGAALGLQLNTGMKEKLDQMEYAIYVDLFYNGNSKDYADMQYTKDGVFATLEDAFNGVTRYYVWGYADQTKCCDYQWEFVMPEGMEIPESGSYVTMTGTLTQSDEALDGYWFTDVTLTVEQPFANAGYDFDMTTISPTLTRVQVINMTQFKDQFDGKTMRIYGRALSMNSVQHPYYDEAWSLDFTYDGDTQFVIGDDILVEGTFNGASEGSFIEAGRITKL